MYLSTDEAKRLKTLITQAIESENVAVYGFALIHLQEIFSEEIEKGEENG